MASTDPLNRITPDHSANILEHENSAGNAIHTPEAVSACLPDDDEQSDVYGNEGATPGAAVDSIRVNPGNPGQQLPFSSPAVEDVDNLTLTSGDEELSPLNITPIRSPNPDNHPDPKSQNPETQAFPEQPQEPHPSSLSNTAQQPDVAEAGNHTHREYPRSNIGGYVPLPVPLVHPRKDPIPPVPSPDDLYPTFLRELRQSNNPAPSPFLSRPGTASHTTPYQSTPWTPQSIGSLTGPASTLPNQDAAVRQTQPIMFGSSTVAPSTMPPHFDQEQQRPPTTGLIVTEPLQNTQPQKPQVTQPPWAEAPPQQPLQFGNPENSQSPEDQQYPAARPPQVPPPNPQRRLPLKDIRPKLGSESQRRKKSQYVNMLLAMDAIPKLHNILAEFLTWILLVGFVLLPGTFPSLQKSGVAGTAAGSVDQRAVHAIIHLPLFVVAWVCTGTGILGMLWLTWRWHKNYIWVLKKIYLPGFKSAFAGFISTLTHIYGIQGGELGTTGEITFIIVAFTTGVCYILTVFYSFWLLGSVKGKDDWQVGVARAGKYGQGVTDPSKRKPKVQAAAAGAHDQVDLGQESKKDQEMTTKIGLVDIFG